MGGNPNVQKFVILKQAVSGRQIFSLKDKLQRNPATGVIGYAEPDRVAGALLWQMRAGFGVSEIARLEFRITGQCLFMALGGACASPWGAKWQACGMRKRKIIGAMCGNEKRTSQNILPWREIGMIVITDAA